MKKLTLAVLLALFGMYSLFVYTKGTAIQAELTFSPLEMAGMTAWNKYNCVACHQRFGLGGYLGPDVTQAYSRRGEVYIKAVLENGVGQMPDLYIPKEDVEALTAYLRALDQLAPPKREEVRFTWYGTVAPK